MSLNWKEIDLVLSELDLVGAQIQRIAQPTFDSVVLGLYGRMGELDLLVSVTHGAGRIHALSRPSPKNERPLRFMECLRSRIRGGWIASARQLGRDRIVEFVIITHSYQGEPGSEGEREETLFRLGVKLWSGAGNIALCDAGGVIIDVLSRRPKRGEIGGEKLAWLAASETGGTGEAVAAGKTREFQVRDLPPPEGRETATFNERVEAWYAARGGELSREKLLEAARERFEKRFSLLETRIGALEERAAKFRNADRTRELGDLIMANLGAEPAGKHLAVEDFFRGGEIHIPIDAAKSLVANATSYYERAKKEASGLGEVEEEKRRWQAELASERAELARIEGLRDALHIAKALDKGGTTRKEREKKYPGLSLVLGEWTILVGRSAKENDELLRRHVRGSDLWLHARDYSGSYVFVKSKPGKSIPLEVLLDAGSLAIYYSKGREAGEGDLYYTWVKYLRRAKDGPKGLVIPSQEKNLFVRVNEARIRELRTLMGGEGE